MIGVETFPHCRRPPLEFVKEELQGVAQQYGCDIEVICGEQCTPLNVLSALRQSTVVHIATHACIERSTSRNGSFDPKGVLLLSPGGFPLKTGHHLWELPAACIAREQLSNLSLVVLSACHTGQGHVLHGLEERSSQEGEMGLSRAFLRAGASSVVSSLCAVNDLTTKDLMISFHRHLAGDTGSRAHALRAAMLEVRHSKASIQHPYFWAAFVLTGAI